MTGDLRQAQLGAMTVSSSTQSPEKLGSMFFVTNHGVARDETLKQRIRNHPPPGSIRRAFLSRIVRLSTQFNRRCRAGLRDFICEFDSDNWNMHTGRYVIGFRKAEPLDSPVARSSGHTSVRLSRDFLRGWHSERSEEPLSLRRTIATGAHPNVAEIVQSQSHSGFATLGWGF